MGTCCTLNPVGAAYKLIHLMCGYQPWHTRVTRYLTHSRHSVISCETVI